jgi:hypothetical protein
MMRIKAVTPAKQHARQGAAKLAKKKDIPEAESLCGVPGVMAR